MEANTRKSIHPLTAIAAVSVTLFSLVGIAAITGLIPTSRSQSAAAQAVVEVPAPAPTEAVAAAAAEPATTAASTTTASEAKPDVHKAAPKHVKPVAHAKRSTEEPIKVAAADTPVMVAQNIPPAYPPANMAPPPPPGTMAPPPPPNAAPPKPICRDCGVIESVREIERPGKASGSGAAVGGIAGGILGNQAGRGNGRTAMTLLGALGGAIAGNEIEKNTAKAKSYEIVIRFDDGTTRLITQDTPPVWRSGDRIRVQNGVITASNAY